MALMYVVLPLGSVPCYWLTPLFSARLTRYSLCLFNCTVDCLIVSGLRSALTVDSTFDSYQVELTTHSPLGDVLARCMYPAACILYTVHVSTANVPPVSAVEV